VNEDEVARHGVRILVVMEPKRLRVALFAPYGEPADGFFADSLLAILAADAIAAGHDAKVLRAYYDGRDAATDASIRQRVTDWLRAYSPDVIAFERLFDPAPIVEYRGARPDALATLVWRGDSFDAVDGVQLAIGAIPGTSKRGGTRRTPTIDELRLAFGRVLEQRASGATAFEIPGVARYEDGRPVGNAVLERPAGPLPFRAIAEQDVIAPGGAPAIVRKTIFGNAGCPYGDDPLERPEFVNIRLPDDRPVSRLGCAFCFMGGDYEKRPDAEIVALQAEQAVFWTRALPSLEELVLTDQAPVRYLAKLVETASGLGVRPIRWLFPARADTFLKELPKVRAAAQAADKVGHTIELYLTGFESFSDAELGRFNKGLDRTTSLAAIEAMRALALETKGFAYSRARGHSLILWSPWTTIDDLRSNLQAFRTHGLGEIFSDVGRNRLRLYKDLPIHWAAERDGLLAEDWEDDDGMARRKGYSVEQPWRFKEAKTRLAFLLVRGLRDLLGPETEISQLAAVLAFVEGLDDDALAEPGRTAAQLLSDVSKLKGILAEIAAIPSTMPTHRARPVVGSGPCNNGCATCPQGDAWTPPGFARTVAESGQGAVVLAGREPTMSPELKENLIAARRAGPISMVTNGRRFASKSFAEAAVKAGVKSVSLKVFAPDAATHDAIARVDGAHAQTLAGLSHLLALHADVELRAPLRAETIDRFEEFALLARDMHVPSLRIETNLEALTLQRVDAAVRALASIRSAGKKHGVAICADTLDAGAVHPVRVPGRS